jgi:MipA family protein
MFGVIMKSFCSIAAIALGLLAQVAHAQTAAAPGTADDSAEAEKDLQIEVGVGVAAAPDYQGSKTYRVLPVPNINITYKDRLFAGAQGIGVNIIKSDALTAGVSLRAGSGRKEKRSPALRGLGKVDITAEPTLFAEYKITEKFGLSTDVSKAVNGHKGTRGNVGFTYADALGPLFVSFGPSLAIADRKYMQAYYGVNAVQSLRSGYRVYTPKGGLESVDLNTGVALPLSNKITLSLFGLYSRLLKQPKNAPFIANGVGNANQFSGGLLIGYKF